MILIIWELVTVVAVCILFYSTFMVLFEDVVNNFNQKNYIEFTGVLLIILFIILLGLIFVNGAIS